MSFAPRPRYLALFLLAVLFQQAPALAGNCVGIAANQLPPGTLGADGLPLGGDISEWYQVTGQCSPAYTTVRAQVPGGRGLVEWWAHAPADCTPSTTTNPNDTLTCPGKPDGRICIYLRTSPAPVGGMTTPVHVAFPDTSVFDGTAPLGGEASPCALTSAETTTTTVPGATTTTLPPVGADFGFTATQAVLPGVGNLGVTGAGTPLDAPNGILDAPDLFARGLQLNLLSTFNVVDVALADVDHDGIADIVAVGNDPAGSRFVLMTGLGDGTFSFPVTVAVSDPRAIAVGDVDLDGSTDVAVAEQECFGISCQPVVLFFDGAALATFPGGSFAPNGTIRQHLVLPGTTAPVSVAFGRLNGDAIGDLVVAEEGNPGVVVTALANGIGGYPTMVQTSLAGTVAPPAPRAVTIAPSNLTADTDLDVFVATSNGVEILENDGSGAFAPGAATGNGTLTAGTSPAGVVVEDVTGDGVADVLAINRGSGTLSTFVANSMTTGYQPVVTSTVGANPIALTTMRFDGDASRDVAVVNGGNGLSGTVTFLAGNGAGSFTTAVTASGGDGSPIFTPRSIAAGHVDVASGTDDIVIADGFYAGLPLFPGGVGLIDSARGGLVPFKLYTAASLAANLDGSGALNDVVLIEQNLGTVFVLLNVAASGPTSVGQLVVNDLFTNAGAMPTSATTFKDALTGLNDIAITDIGTPTGSSGFGQIVVGLNDGTGSFFDVTGFRQFVATPGATSILSGDFNADGHDDLVYVDFLSNFAAVALNDGANFFLTPRFRETGGFIPVSAVVADVNDDDRLDLVVANQGGGGPLGDQSVVTVLLGQGDGTLVPTGELLQVPNFALSIVGGLADLNGDGSRRTVDFNNDGFPDFAVVSSRGVPSVTLLLNRPDKPGSFTVMPPIPLVDESSPGTIFVLEDDYLGPELVSGRHGEPVPGGLGRGGANAVLGAGDFNADGSPDLVVTGTAAGRGGSGFRGAIYLLGDAHDGTLRVSRGIRSRFATNPLDSKPYYAGPATSDLRDQGDSFVAAVPGDFGGGSIVPDVLHVSLNGNLWVDANQTSILNHAPIVGIRRDYLNAPNPGGGRKTIVEPGATATIPVTGFDADGDPLRFSLVPTPTGEAPPSFVTLDDHGDGSATVIVAPPIRSAPGTFRIAVEAADAAGDAGAQLPLTGRDYFTLVVRFDPSCAASPQPRADTTVALRSCDDRDPCTDDSCVEGQGCLFTDRSGVGFARCVCDESFGAACDGQKLPKALKAAFHQACMLLGKADTAKKQKKARKLAGRAAKLLGKGKKLAHPKKPKFSAECGQALADFFADAQQRATDVATGSLPTSSTTTTTSTTSTSTSGPPITTSTMPPGTTTTTIPGCPVSQLLPVRTVVNPLPGTTGLVTWSVPIAAYGCATLPSVALFDLATGMPLGPTLYASTSHTETVVHDPLTGLPVVEMRLTNHAASGGGERLVVYATATWP
jgi:hypothetical protein